MTSFRFFHTADIHLDSPLKGLAGLDGNAVDRIRTATREAFRNLIGHALEEQVDFLIIAGDLYDGDWRDYNTGLFFVQQMGRLNEAGIPVFLLYGNHDAESQITRRLELPENVQVFSARKPETYRLEALNVALHGQSFRDRSVTENLAQSYPDPTAGAFNIGVLHTALGGMGGHENYAPCTRPELVNKGYDYWALGHVHGAAILHERPYIVFPGNLQGRHIRETGAKGAKLVRVTDADVREVSSITCDVVRWAEIAVNVGGAGTRREAEDSMRTAIAEAVENIADDRLLACRILLQGKTSIHDELLRTEEDLIATARGFALGQGHERAWIEQINIETEAETPMETLIAREDALGELYRIMTDAKDDAALLATLRADLGTLAGSLPEPVRREVEDDLLTNVINANQDVDYGRLIDGIWPFLSARLNQSER